MIDSLSSGLLSFLIDGTVSMLVAGGRGAGKTSVLGSLMLEILPKTRIVTIQDTLELPVEQLRELNYNPKLFYGDGYKGLPTFAPFDKILITAGAPEIPKELLKQLAKFDSAKKLNPEKSFFSKMKDFFR
jgi:GTPase SAR1 family protein